jgi:hypothetical protein
VWYLPVDAEAPTATKWMAHLSEAIGATPKFQVLPSWLIGAVGLFVPVMKEMHEMLYQYDRPYVW